MRRAAVIVAFLFAAFACVPVHAANSITDTSLRWPSMEELLRVLSMRDYNTRVVMIGASLLGAAAGAIGSFMLLRRRALLGDAVSHASLPGIALAFIVMTAAGGTGKFLPGLLLGALTTGLLGMGLILVIRKHTRLKEDAALGIVLSVFFGLGIALLGVIQKMRQGHAAGLESFIYGKTASMLAADATLIAGVAAVVLVLCLLLFKELRMVCFDQDYAAAQGWPVQRLDALMMGLVVVVTVIGLQAVGLILVIALLIVPAAAARFWTNRLSKMILLASVIGSGSCLLGAALSALMPRLPAGAIIVATACVLFVISMVFAPERGVLARVLAHTSLQSRVARQHLLRAMFENFELAEPALGRDGVTLPQGSGIGLDALAEARSWTPRELRRLLRVCARARLIYRLSDATWRLTDDGLIEARRVVRNHRLWEIYLITHADIAPSHVDRDADQIEHVLGRAMVEKLQALLDAARPGEMPPSPHPITRTTA